MVTERPKRKPTRPAKADGVLPASQYPYMVHPDRSNLKSVAAFLNITPRAIYAGLARLAKMEARVAEGWFCIHCGRRITKGKAEKVFCSDSCRGHYHRDAKRLDARLDRLMAKLGG